MTHTDEPRGAVTRHAAYLPHYRDKDSNSRHLWRISWGHPGFTHRTPPEPTPDRRPTVLVRAWERLAPDGRHWITHAQRLYPAGRFDNGGPVRTIRTGIEKRHLPGKAPGGGYDLSVEPAKAEPRIEINETLPLDDVSEGA
ncbi:DUF6349 family protein [Streptomyces sp. NBC_01597]|uniref:DUF6349 family protein n=1 Tax=Streptomyces sp. NBC_01597 TaxID=2975891 RepID=UPI003864B5B4